MGLRIKCSLLLPNVPANAHFLPVTFHYHSSSWPSLKASDKCKSQIFENSKVLKTKPRPGALFCSASRKETLACSRCPDKRSDILQECLHPSCENIGHPSTLLQSVARRNTYVQDSFLALFFSCWDSAFRGRSSELMEFDRAPFETRQRISKDFRISAGSWLTVLC